jgi:hypothetical protein
MESLDGVAIAKVEREDNARVKVDHRCRLTAVAICGDDFGSSDAQNAVAEVGFHPPKEVGKRDSVRGLRRGFRREARDRASALCNLDFFSGTQEFFNLWEVVAEIADGDSSHVSHFSITLNFGCAVPLQERVSSNIFVFYSPFHRFVRYACFSTTEVARWTFKKN